jgi:TonB family protein
MSRNAPVRCFVGVGGLCLILFFARSGTPRLQGQASNDAVPQPVAPRQIAENAVPEKDGAYAEKDVLIAPQVIFSPEPKYTDEAIRAQWNGDVSISVIVNEDGSLSGMKIKNPPPYGLEDNVLEALDHWRFKPAEKNGNFVAVHAKIDVHLHLPKDAEKENN